MILRGKGFKILTLGEYTLPQLKRSAKLLGLEIELGPPQTAKHDLCVYCSMVFSRVVVNDKDEDKVVKHGTLFNMKMTVEEVNNRFKCTYLLNSHLVVRQMDFSKYDGDFDKLFGTIYGAHSLDKIVTWEIFMSKMP